MALAPPHARALISPALIALGLIALSLALLAPGPLHAQAPESFCPSGVLTIGTDATFPPFASKEDGAFVGMEIDLGEALAKGLGCEVRWVNSSFDGIFPALLAGKYAFVIASVTITPERQKAMLFTDPYIDAGQSIAVRRADAPIAEIEGLDGKKVGVGLNTTGQFLMEGREKVSLTKYPSVDLALADLSNGRLDAAVVDGPVLRYMIREGFPQLKVTGRPLNSEQWGIALAPEATALKARLDALLAQFRRDGTLKALEDEYLSEPKADAPGASAIDGAGAAGTLPAAPTRQGFNTERFIDALPLFFKGAQWTLLLAALSFAAAVPLGLLIAVGRMSPLALFRIPATACVEILRGTPLLVQIFFIYFVLPAFGLTLSEVTTAVLALSVNASAYVAEIFRAGLESLDRGQSEAALALGLSRRQTLRYVLVPQAFRRVVPPLTNEAIALIKDSSLVSIMGMTELTRTGQELASRYADPLTIWPGVALVYFLLTFPLTRLSSALETRLAKGDARH